MRFRMGIRIICENLKHLIAEEEAEYCIGILNIDVRRQFSFSIDRVAEEWEGVEYRQFPWLRRLLARFL